jgi:hypothetical protein
VRLRLEQLEDRTLPSNLFAATVSDLIKDINAANKAGGSNTILLAANTTFDLTTVDNTTDGATGLPVITTKDSLTITGQGGDIIQRDTAALVPVFRLFDVASRATLMLNSLTLQNGLEVGSGRSAQGGAIYNEGMLILSSVTVQGNTALGSDGATGTFGNPSGGTGGDAEGGGIWSNATLTLENGTTIQNNLAVGGYGGGGIMTHNNGGFGGTGGSGYGGGVYVAGGTVSISSTTLSSNTAKGGHGGFGSGPEPFLPGPGGSGYGGGVYLAAGTATLSSDTLANNLATGGIGTSFFSDPRPNGYGGALYVASGTVTLSSDTVDGNQALGAFSYAYQGAGCMWLLAP